MYIKHIEYRIMKCEVLLMDSKAKVLANIIDLRGSRTAFAKEIGLPPTTLQSMLTRGVGGASIDKVIKICHALGITVEQLEELANEETTDNAAKLPSNLNLSAQDLNLLNNFNKLNKPGKEEAAKRVKELTYIPEYTDYEYTPPIPKPDTLVRELPMRDYSVAAGLGNYIESGSFELVTVPAEVPQNVQEAIKIQGDSMSPKIPDGSIVWVRLQPDVDIGDICIVFIDDESFCKVIGKDGFESLNPSYETIVPGEYKNARIYGKVVCVQMGDEVWKV